MSDQDAGDPGDDGTQDADSGDREAEAGRELRDEKYLRLMLMEEAFGAFDALLRDVDPLPVFLYERPAAVQAHEVPHDVAGEIARQLQPLVDRGVRLATPMPSPRFLP